MAFLAGMMGYHSGAASGKHDAYADALKRAAEEADRSERAREFDVTAKQNASRDAAQQRYYDAQAKHLNTPPESLVPQEIKAFRSALKLPDKWAAMSDGDKVSYLQRRWNAAIAVGDTDTANATMQIANGIALNAQRFANADYTSGAKTDLAGSQVRLNDARTAAERDLPVRARAIAQGHDAAAWQRAQAQIGSRAELAQFGANARVGLVQLAAAYALRGKSQDEAVNIAIAQYRGDVQQRLAATDPRRTLLADPNATPQPMPQLIMPPTAPQSPITINLGFDRQGNLVEKPQPGGAAPGGRTKTPVIPPVKKQGPAAATPVLSADGQKALSAARDALKSLSLADVVKFVSDPKTFPKISPAERATIVKAISPQALPAGGFKSVLQGGGTAPLPF